MRVWAAAAALLFSGCVKPQLVSMKDAYHEGTQTPVSGEPVLLLPVTETAGHAEPVYLGKLLSKMIAFGPIPLIPFNVEYDEFRADAPRTALVRAALADRLRARGIPSEDGSPAKGRLALSADLRFLKLSGKQGFQTFISVSGFDRRDETARVALDCKLWRGGESAPVWEGSAEAAFSKKQVGETPGADNIYASAAAAAAEQCVEKSGVAALRAGLAAKGFAELYRRGEYAEAYRLAVTPEQTLSAVQGMARAYAGKEIPESAHDLMARGRAAAALAKKPADFESAADEMEKAVNLAPWWAAGHYNTALAAEGAGRWLAGAKHLKIYLQLKPDAEDKEAARAKLAEMELREERGIKPDAD